jgi:hypothetical protein
VTRQDALRVCRELRRTECGAAFRALLEGAAQSRVQALVTAEPERVARLQGAVLALRELLKEIETEPAPADRRDGAYV